MVPSTVRVPELVRVFSAWRMEPEREERILTVVPEKVSLRRKLVPFVVRPWPAEYVVSVSASVPQEKRPVVASQARVWFAASQSVRPTPVMEVAM